MNDARRSDHDSSEVKIRYALRASALGGMNASARASVVNRTHRVVRERAQGDAGAAQSCAQPDGSAGDLFRRC